MKTQFCPWSRMMRLLTICFVTKETTIVSIQRHCRYLSSELSRFVFSWTLRPPAHSCFSCRTVTWEPQGAEECSPLVSCYHSDKDRPFLLFSYLRVSSWWSCDTLLYNWVTAPVLSGSQALDPKISIPRTIFWFPYRNQERDVVSSHTRTH